MNYAQMIDPERARGLRQSDGQPRQPSPLPPRGVVTHVDGIDRVAPLPVKAAAPPPEPQRPKPQLVTVRRPENHERSPRCTGATQAILDTLAKVAPSQRALGSGEILLQIKGTVECEISSVCALLAGLINRREVQKLGACKPFLYRITDLGRKRAA